MTDEQRAFVRLQSAVEHIAVQNAEQHKANLEALIGMRGDIKELEVQVRKTNGTILIHEHRITALERSRLVDAGDDAKAVKRADLRWIFTLLAIGGSLVAAAFKLAGP